MGKIIAICGKICCGKSHYARRLKEKYNAVILSSDELMVDLFHHQEAEKHDDYARDIQKYLHKKAVEITAAGCDVILDWGFWTKSHRQETTDFYADHNINCEWHYIDISDKDWYANIENRNSKILAGLSDDYYMDEGLFKKLMDRFEQPDRSEIDVWYKFTRE